MTIAGPDATRRAPSPGSLAGWLVGGEARAALTFAGQGVDPIRELAALVRERPEAAATVAHADLVLAEEADRHASSGRYRYGLDLARWTVDPESAPPDRYLRSTAVSHPLILVAQLAAWRVLWADGLGAVVDAGAIAALTGHSQGMYPALAIAGAPGGLVDDDHLERALRIVCLQGRCMADAEVRVDLGADGDPRTPMVAVGGVRLRRLQPIVDEVAATLRTGSLVIALHNGPTRFVVSGHLAALASLRERLESIARTEAAARKRGALGGSPLTFTWSPLPVATPFHGPEHAAPLARFLDEVDPAWLPSADDLWAPVVSGADGSDLRKAPDLLAAVATGQFVAPVRWDLAVPALVEHGASWVLDVGPGTDVARFDTELVRGTGARALGLATPEGRRILATPGAAPKGLDLAYADLVPGIVEMPDGTRHLDNRHTRLTGRPPVVLAGMTPTTADVAIVAAAASAGYAAELAGSGQPTADLFERRVAELAEVLPPGAEVGFNALYLDRHLWDLQFGSGALVWEARRRGIPFDGVTISAGIPEVDEAVALLDRFVAHGLVRNAFKPGTVDQVRQVLAIADAAPHHTVIVQIEGGKAGGHHSWEDLDDLLLATYHDLRLRPNVVVVAGGGIGRPERAADLLDGRWALAHGEGPMPIDGVLLGTVAMATAESTASPQVKAALVAAGGSDSWVPWRGSGGGVTSGRSNLDADIHTLDNAAAVAGHLLEEVAGDEAAVAARRDEIVDALSRTAKPYFGDVESMTYAAVLERLVACCAIGRHGRYDDGAWGDPSWRAKALAVARRFAARLAPEQVGSVEPALAELADLDDPAVAIETFARAYPASAVDLVHPADADRFVAICAEPGKPVPFVPVLDAQVRAWYLRDALWQAHDDRYPADSVFVIPGPEAVAGIERADEPVADLLRRFEAVALDRAAAAGAMADARDRLGDPGPIPPHLRSLVEGRSGSVAELLASPSVLVADRRERNPLWSLLAAGDRLRVEGGDATGTASLVLHGEPARAEGEHVEVRAEADGSVVARAAIPSADGEREDVLELRFERHGDAGRSAFSWVDRSAALGRWYAAALDAPALDGPELAPDEAPGTWTVDGGQVAAYRSLTGAEHQAIPLDLAFSWAWPALLPLLGGPLAADLGALLHVEHQIERGPAWPPAIGATGASTVEVESDRATPNGRELRCRIELTVPAGAVPDGDQEPDQRVATVRATLLIRTIEHTGPSIQRRQHDVVFEATAGRLDALAEQPWIAIDPEVPVAPGDELRLVAQAQLAGAPGEPVRRTASGRIEVDGRPWATVELADESAGFEHPVDALAVLLAAPSARQDRFRRPLATAEDVAPASGSAFAVVGGDANPLHRSILAARLSGLDEPVLHGLWTAARAEAFVVDALAGGDPGRLADWHVRFTAPVLAGALIDLTAERIGHVDGSAVVEVVVEADDEVVAIAEAVISPPRTAQVFPGQGIQRTGLGAEQRARSAAARAVWAEADQITRSALGFSVLDVVERNPVELVLADGTTSRHPDGVLFLTEHTQVAMAALAAAQRAELSADGGPSAELVAGHSIGEFNALAALGVLPLEVVLPLVWERGRAMQRHVPRRVDGTSPYRLAVLDPSAAGLDDQQAEAVVAQVAADTGELLEVVNRNAPGRQHAVAGTVTAIEALTAELAARRAGRGDAVQVINGIDVPFHSSVLRPAVDDLRTHLLELVPASVDPEALVGRWIPNLVGRPFELTPDFVDRVVAAGGRPPAAGSDGRALARHLLVELLANQLAAPVQWVDTVRWLARPVELGGLGVDRIIEVGPAHAGVLTNLARSAWAAEPTAGVEVVALHVERDRDTVLDRVVEDAVDGPAGGDAAEGAGTGEPDAAPEVVPEPIAIAAGEPTVAGGAPSSGGRVDGGDLPVDGSTALLAVLALQARVRPDQIDDGEQLDDLFGGASSRRNQVLIDLGRELGLTGTDGIGDLTLGRFRTELAGRTASYQYPGPYLRDTVASSLSRVLAPAGLGRREAVAHLTGTWGLGPGLVDHVLLRLALDSRSGPSARGGELSTVGADLPANAAAGRALLDQLVGRVATSLGRSVTAGVAAATEAGPAVGGAVVDVLVAAAQDLAAALGSPSGAEVAGGLADDEVTPLDRLAQLERELGDYRAAALAPQFDHRRAVRFASGASFARWDLIAASAGTGLDELEVALQQLAGWAADPVVGSTARWLARSARDRGDAPTADRLVAFAAGEISRPPLVGWRPSVEVGADGRLAVADVPCPDRPADLVGAVALPLRAPVAAAIDGSHDASPGTVALITGASPGSIAIEAVRHLLAAGATVVVTSSSLSVERRRWYRDVYRTSAAPGAELHVVPANLASFADVDALLAWLADPEIPQRGRDDLRLGSLLPTVVLPFAAVSTVGSAVDAGPGSEVALRVQLLGVERLVAGIGELLGQRRREEPATVVLPLSPNHGTFGGDGPYGDAKAALEVLVARRRSEAAAWGAHIRLVSARIGWVRGTGLMGRNDGIAAAVEDRLGVRTFAADEMGTVLAAAALAASSGAVGDDAEVALDLTGGLDAVEDLRGALLGLGAELLARSDAAAEAHRIRTLLDGVGRPGLADRAVAALPGVAGALRSAPDAPAAFDGGFAVPEGRDPADLVVIVGSAELGPHGMAATRFEAEVDGAPSPAGIVELAWLCGLVRYEGSGADGRWVDVASGDPVAEEDLVASYGDEVVARTGLRPLERAGSIDPDGIDVLSTVHLDRDLVFEVSSEAEARSHLVADPVHTTVRQDSGSEAWQVVRRAGAAVRVARKVPHSRRVAGQFPAGLDLGRFGIAGELLTTADISALVNLACTTEAFADAGTTPEELLGEVHPALVANTQGAGMGGMGSLRHVLLDHLLDQERQNDRLQESLGNVVAAHVVQGYVGSYGSMVHPVAACATAAVSLELAVEQIATGRALAVLAGGFDDITTESVLGFADMHATASSDELEAMGIAPCESSRANDLRRRGFVESQGGGAALVVRGDVAVALGLPVQAVVAYAASFGDGINTSIPAPGVGAAACVRGGAGSPLAEALGRLGLTADDVAVVSKHDTSTEQNDPNEAFLHQHIQDELGRTPGNPLLVVSQKTVTGHAKGGAAAWQLDGVIQMMRTGTVPGNRVLESIDPLVEQHDHLAHGYRPIQRASGDPIRAALITSLGFGHVSAVVALAHPGVFEATIPADALDGYRERADRRRAEGEQRRRRTRLGRPDPVRRTDRRVGERDDEVAALADPTTRVVADRLSPG